MRIGSQVGHPSESPVADPTARNTPKPGLVMNVPSPRKAKFRPSPEILSGPAVTSAPTAPKLTSSSLSAAPVFRLKSRAVSVTNSPSVMRMVSTSNRKALTRLASKSSARRIAGSLPRLLMVAEIGLPGRKRAPLVCTKISPSKRKAWPKITSKSWMPTVMSSSSRMPPMLILLEPPARLAVLSVAPGR